MGRKRTVGLEWLEPENIKQRLWALDYLRAKGFNRLFHFRDKILPTEFPSHSEMLHAGMDIEQEACARELFRDMKDAWRQERDRNKKKNSGRQVCAFSLNTTTKVNLQEMAKDREVSATALLEILIEKAFRKHKSKTEKQTKIPRAASNYSFQGLNKAIKGNNKESETQDRPTLSQLGTKPKMATDDHQDTSQGTEGTTYTTYKEDLPAPKSPQLPEALQEQGQALNQLLDSPPESRAPPVNQVNPEPQKSGQDSEITQLQTSIKDMIAGMRARADTPKKWQVTSISTSQDSAPCTTLEDPMPESEPD